MWKALTATLLVLLLIVTALLGWTYSELRSAQNRLEGAHERTMEYGETVDRAWREYEATLIAIHEAELRECVQATRVYVPDYSITPIQVEIIDPDPFGTKAMRRRALGLEK